MHELTRASWLMEPTALSAMLRRLSKVRSFPTPMELEGAREAAAGKLKKVTGKVAVLPVQGMIDNRFSFLNYLFGGFSCEQAAAALSSMLANKDISAIVLDVDSPGGTSQGVEELADMIYEARATKPVFAVANAMACSAAYWIASAATGFYCVPSGTVGSVGVYAAHVDISAALAEEGVKVTLVKAGKYKAEWLPYSPLSEDAAQYMQDEVDTIYARFVAAVAKNRDTSASDVKNNYGQGRSMDARSASAAKMIDGMTTLDAALEKLTGGNASMGSQGRRASAEVLRLRHQQRMRTVPL